MFLQRSSFFKRTFEKVKAIFIFHKVEFLWKNCIQFSYFAKSGFFLKKLGKLQGAFQTRGMSSFLQRTLDIFNC
jgi:hypothetical protein